MARAGEIIEVADKDGVVSRHRIVELPVDPPNSIRRYLVPVDTDEDDVPLGGRLLDERETAGQLARASRPDNIMVGDSVRRASKPGEPLDEKTSIKGTVEAKLKHNKFRIRFEDGTNERLEAKDLSKVW